MISPTCMNMYVCNSGYGLSVRALCPARVTVHIISRHVFSPTVEIQNYFGGQSVSSVTCHMSHQSKHHTCQLNPTLDPTTEKNNFSDAAAEFFVMRTLLCSLELGLAVTRTPIHCQDTDTNMMATENARTGCHQPRYLSLLHLSSCL